MRLNKSLVRGSAILLISFGLFNFFGFVFQLSMARMLSLPDYGELAVLYSILYILSVISESIQTVVVKYSSNENKNGRLKTLLKKSLKKSFSLSIVMFLIYLVVAIPLTYMLKINYILLALNGLMIFSVFILSINRGVLQGKKKFRALGLNMVLESSMKLGLSVLFVYFGFRVYGAMIGTVFGVFIAIVLSFIPLKGIIKSKEIKSQTEGIYGYALPTFIIT